MRHSKEVWRGCPHLVGNLAEGILQFAVQHCQLLEVSVGFMDGNEDLVDFVDCLVEPTLRTVRRWSRNSKSHPSREEKYCSKSKLEGQMRAMRDNWCAKRERYRGLLTASSKEIKQEAPL